MKAGMLRNTATGRFHPILFHPAPFPGQTGDLPIGSVMRYRSIGHHTEGFSTLDEALAHVKTTYPGYTLLEGIDEWDGQDVPASTIFLPVLT